MCIKFLTSQEKKIFLSFLIIYATFANYTSWHEDSHLDLTRALVEDKSININSYYLNTGDRSYFNGNYYSIYAPGASVVAVPIYLAHRYIFGIIPPETEFLNHENISRNYALLLFLIIFFTSALMTSLTCVLLFRILGYYTQSQKLKFLTIVAYGLGTVALSNATFYVAETIGSFFIFSSFYLVFNSIYKKKDDSILAGFLGGLAVFTFPPLIIPVVFILSLLITKKCVGKVQRFIIGVIPLIGLFLIYNYVAFGHPLSNSYANNDLTIFGDVAGNPLGSMFKNEFHPLQLHKEALANFSVNILVRILIYPYRGFFFYSPVLLLSLYGLVIMYREDKSLSLVISAIAALSLLFFSMISLWWSGSTFGHMYSMPIIIFLMIPVFFAFKKLPLKISIVILSISVIVNLSGMQIPTQSYLISDPNNEPMLSLAPEYYQRFNSAKPIANPLFDYYFPKTLANGPQSLLLEKIGGKPIGPYKNVMVLVLILSLIWSREITSFFKRKTKKEK